MDKIEKLYTAAKKDEKFKEALWVADNDVITGKEDDSDIAIIAMMYYGWLIHLYGASFSMLVL